MKKRFKIPTLIKDFTLATALFVAMAARSEPTGFKFSLECRTSSTNRTKFTWPEFTSSCPGTPVIRVYRRMHEVMDWRYRSVEDLSPYPNHIIEGAYHNVADWVGDGIGDILTNYTGNSFWNDYYVGDPVYFCTNTWTKDDEVIDGCGALYQMENFIEGGQTSFINEYTKIYTNYSNYDIPPYDQVFYGSTVTTLLDEYTTPELLSTNGFDYPSEWLGGDGAKSQISDTEQQASIIRKAQYRFKVVAPPGERFEISYTVHLRTDDGYYTNWNQKLSGVGTGQVVYYPEGGPIEFEPPYRVKTVDGCPRHFGGAKWIELGCGGLVGGSGCGGCDSSPGAITSTLEDFGLNITASLGKDSFGEHSGELTIAASAPTNRIMTPAGLSYLGGLGDAIVIPSGGDLRQIMRPDLLADIVTLSGTSYEIRFYTDPGTSNETRVGFKTGFDVSI